MQLNSMLIHEKKKKGKEEIDEEAREFTLMSFLE